MNERSFLSSQFVYFLGSKLLWMVEKYFLKAKSNGNNGVPILIITVNGR